jgi:uncharacterized protein
MPTIESLERRIMLNIDEMSAKESRELLQKVGYGHLGFIYEGEPSVIPVITYGRIH